MINIFLLNLFTTIDIKKIFSFFCHSDIKASWEEWWTYDGISGPGQHKT
jgi:hypothetical protein